MNRDGALGQLKFHLKRAQDHMSKFLNRHRRISTIMVRDIVYLKIHPHQLQSMVARLHPKMSARFYGPFLVINKVGTMAYKL